MRQLAAKRCDGGVEKGCQAKAATHLDSQLAHRQKGSAEKRIAVQNLTLLAPVVPRQAGLFFEQISL